MKRRGFTLIELLAVILVLAIIAVITVPTLIGVINKARINSLKNSAEGLIEASNLYYAQYQNINNIRFDIEGSNVVSNDTTNLLKFKGSVKEGVAIIKGNGQTVVCVTDGKNSAYKNYNESKVSLVDSKCTIPDNTSIVYLDDKPTFEADTSDLIDRISELETRLSELESNNIYATKGELSQVNTTLSSNILTNTGRITQLNNDLTTQEETIATKIQGFGTVQSVSLPYTPQSDGFLVGIGITDGNGSFQITQTGGATQRTLAGASHWYSFCLPVVKNKQVVKNSGSINTIHFIPLVTN